MDLKNKELKKLKDEIEANIKKEFGPDDMYKAYLSKKGKLTQMLRKIGEMNKKERAQFGKEANILKNFIEEKIESMQAGDIGISRYEKPIDVTAPFDVNTKPDKRPQLNLNEGTQHPITKELEYVLSIFYEMGFNVEECRQLDDDYHMFESLNFPKGHPARDNWDTFWTTDNLILPAHTSTMQNRVLKKYDLPIRAVIPGRCYRNEATDASHEHTFYQIEGVYVDRDISLGDMVGTIQTYLEAFFKQKLDVKLQPAYFPFTEPDVEFLISCPFCNKTGCTTCGNTGWMEIMGCGVIHPNVLREGGIDPDEYSGFAWGFGLDRMVMIKNAIEDIRWFHSGNLDFLEQFKPN